MSWLRLPDLVAGEPELVRDAAGDLFEVLVHGDRTMKRLRRREGRQWLVPEPATGHVFPEIIVDEDVEVWGVVVGVARRCG